MAKTNWQYDDIVTEADMNTLGTELNANTTKLAESTSAAIANRLPIRDSNGRFKVGAPVDSDDVARKDTVDNAIMMGIQRQALINGNFDVWQRGTRITNPVLPSFLSDRFLVAGTADGGTFPVLINSQLVLTQPELPGSHYAYRVSPNGSGSGFGATASYCICQRIENATKYLCGTGKKLTLSFWARSSISGKKIGVSCAQRYGTGGSPSANEQIQGKILALSPVWTKYTVVINTNTLQGKTLGSNNDNYFQIGIYYMWGSANATILFGSGTAETFVGSGDIDIAQVQVNAGDTALPFQPRSFGEELALCQRYYEKSYPENVTPAFYTGLGLHITTLNAANYIAGARLMLGSQIKFKVDKRVVPTISFYNDQGQLGRWWAINYGDVVLGTNYTSTTGVNLISMNAINITAASEIYGHWTADAEL
ncbi:hypothetical protein [Paenibacillus nasutitermitis]|uniref:Uncharacterized protein n=1 Tax=Paenibacillus nasutitermitis TaxID=1652958 RepID=A0A916ZG58_9BACL|nr:hypothetical protein [Paenibacillus nasutitermitis]GGD95232.1 hypothetical protein GCM10010911_62410 [Paenibacillus nasutitermitis]